MQAHFQWACTGRVVVHWKKLWNRTLQRSAEPDYTGRRRKKFTKWRAPVLLCVEIVDRWFTIFKKKTKNYDWLWKKIVSLTSRNPCNWRTHVCLVWGLLPGTLAILFHVSHWKPRTWHAGLCVVQEDFTQTKYTLYMAWGEDALVYIVLNVKLIHCKNAACTMYDGLLQ